MSEVDPPGSDRESPSATSITVEVVDALTRELDDVIDGFAERLSQDLCLGRPSEAESISSDRLRGAARRVALVALAAIRASRGLTPGDRAVVAGVAADGAERNLAVEVLVEALHGARAAAWDRAVAIALEVERDGSLDVHELGQLGAAFLRVGDDLEAALLAGHGRVQSARGHGRRRTRSQMLVDLLSGVFDDDSLVANARPFGLDLRQAHGLMLLSKCGTEPTVGTLTAAEAALAGRLSALQVDMSGDAIPHAVLVVPAGASIWDEAVALVGQVSRAHRVHGVIVPPVVGPAAIHAAYTRTRALLPVIRAAFRRPEVVDVGALAPYALLAGARTRDREALVQRTLGPILAQLEPSRSNMLDALDVLTDAGGHTETAAAMLGVHHNTVRYRLGRIAVLTGLQYERSADRFVLQLAVMTRRLSDVPRIDD